MSASCKKIRLLAIAVLVLPITTGCDSRSENERKIVAFDTPTVSPTSPLPAATPSPIPVQRKDVRLTGLMIGRGLNARNEIINPTSEYHTNDSIYALVRTNGRGPEATITLRCTDASGTVVFEQSRTIKESDESASTFTLTSAAKFAPGQYRLLGLLDNYPTMAVSFDVS